MIHFIKNFLFSLSCLASKPTTDGYTLQNHTDRKWNVLRNISSHPIPNLRFGIIGIGRTPTRTFISPTGTYHFPMGITVLYKTTPTVKWNDDLIQLMSHRWNWLWFRTEKNSWWHPSSTKISGLNVQKLLCESAQVHKQTNKQQEKEFSFTRIKEMTTENFSSVRQVHSFVRVVQR